MSDVYIPKAKAIGRRLDDVRHRLAIVFLSEEAPEPSPEGVAFTAGWAVALVAVETGKVLVWDGWYSVDLEERRLPVDGFEDVAWDEWHSTPSRLLVECMRPWLAGPVAEWLAPTFSVAREAASMFASHFDTFDDLDTQRHVRDATVVAYIPLVDEDVLSAEVERLESRLHYGDGSIAQALSSALGALDDEGDSELKLGD